MTRREAEELGEVAEVEEKEEGEEEEEEEEKEDTGDKEVEVEVESEKLGELEAAGDSESVWHVPGTQSSASPRSSLEEQVDPLKSSIPLS